MLLYRAFSIVRLITTLTGVVRTSSEVTVLACLGFNRVGERNTDQK